MKLATRTRYGTRALMELALHQGSKPMLLKEIARRQQISLPYLEHIIAPLIAGGIIRSTKGPRGGISLARKPQDIRLIEITRLLEGSLAPVECIDNPGVCTRSSACVTRDVWTKMKEGMDEVLESTTLQDLVENHRKKSAAEPSMFYI